MATSIGISDSLKIRLASFKKMYGLETYEDTLNVMLNYFAEVGDDPTNPQFTAKKQMLEMNKRLNQVVAFQRTFETKKLQPMLDELAKFTRYLLELLPSGAIATKADMTTLTGMVQELATHEDLTKAIMQIYDVLHSEKPQ
jgi:hypothetical protein